MCSWRGYLPDFLRPRTSSRGSSSMLVTLIFFLLLATFYGLGYIVLRFLFKRRAPSVDAAIFTTLLIVFFVMWGFSFFEKDPHSEPSAPTCNAMREICPKKLL